MPEREHFGLLEDATFELLDKAGDITGDSVYGLSRFGRIGDIGVVGFVVDENNPDVPEPDQCRLIVYVHDYRAFYATPFTCALEEQLLHDGIAIDDPEFDDRIQHAGEIFVQFHRVEPVRALRWT